MKFIQAEHIELEAQQAQVQRHELVARIAQALPRDGVVEAMPGLFLARASAPATPRHMVYGPSFCVIAQGSKEVLVGEERFQYDPGRYLLATLDLPVASRIIEASPERPYLSLRLNLDPALVSSMMVEAGQLPRGNGADARAMTVSSLTAELLDAVVRLVRLLNSPAEARILAPMVTREIVYRLLAGEQGARLRHLAVLGGQGQRIAQAVARLRGDFDKPLRIEDLAREFGMSASGFHAHFKAVTAMSPLQFQKQLRLQEARRLMLSEDIDAAGAGYRVGYDNASHFSREYKRLFGEPPMRDVERVREAAGAGAHA
ncbi:MAG TPA: AraC family transcriptional regulator [Armatimonadota bacterium]|jgi:AraC-like DNA-binding protein